MAAVTFCEPLPLGKRYHIFFFHVKSTRDEEWVKSLKHRLHEIGFLSGSSTEDFDPKISNFKNIQLHMEESVILAFIISEYSIRSSQFMHNLEITLQDIIEQKSPCLPILLDNCTMPKCLQNYRELEIGKKKFSWWSKLIRVLTKETWSSSGKPDKELEEKCENLKDWLDDMSVERRNSFRCLCWKAGIGQMMSQTGTLNTQKVFLKGCGVEIINNNLILKWDRFDGILRESSDVLVKIMRFNQVMDITETMAAVTFCEPLPLGKRYHIFFFHVSSSRDEEWVKSLKHSLHEIGFLSGSSTEDFDPKISNFKNIQLHMEESVILAFIISEYSIRSSQFMHNLEITLQDIIEQKSPCLPILLDNCTMPKCLQNYIELEIGKKKFSWWSKLIRVLTKETWSSSGKPDKELEEMCDNLKDWLVKMSVERQNTFRCLCWKAGIGQMMSQTGTLNTQKVFLEGCGVEIINNNLILKWDRFDGILRESSDVLVKIMRFNQVMDITEVTFTLTTEAHEKLIQECPRYTAKIVKFLENSLLYDLCDTDYDRMTYNIRFEGHTNYKLLKSVNNIVRHLYLDKYQSKSSHLDTLEKRMETYHDWPYPSRVDAIKALAMVGYIYSGYRDTVTCFACNQSLYGISKDISDNYERYVKNHAYWNLDCPYLQLQHSEAMDMPLLKSNPYVVENEIPLSERVERNESHLLRYSHVQVGFDAPELANAGFYIYMGSSKETDFGVICGACHYMTYTSTFSDLRELEEKHMMWSGDECPYLVEKKGLNYIKQFQKDRNLSTQYRSSLTFKAIKIKRDH